MKTVALLLQTIDAWSLAGAASNAKRLLILAFLVISAGTVVAQGTVIFWNHDTDSSVEVTISGTGAQGTTPSGGAGWGGIITSPSGMWRLSAGDWASYASAPPSFLINHDGSLVFLPPTASDRNDLGGPAESFFNSATNSGSAFLWQPSGWAGGETLFITSAPILSDRSTWTWTLDYQARGPSLSIAPEPGTASLGTLAAGVLAARARRRRRSK